MPVLDLDKESGNTFELSTIRRHYCKPVTQGSARNHDIKLRGWGDLGGQTSGDGVDKLTIMSMSKNLVKPNIYRLLATK